MPHFGIRFLQSLGEAWDYYDKPQLTQLVWEPRFEPRTYPTRGTDVNPLQLRWVCALNKALIVVTVLN
jgi:hypothetical protein